MSHIYCPKCFALRRDRTGHCRTCGRWSPATRTYLTTGVLVLSAGVGFAVTAVYAGLVHLTWEKWVLRFSHPLGADDVGEERAAQAVILIGCGVFTLSAALAAAAFGRRGQGGATADDPGTDGTPNPD